MIRRKASSTLDATMQSVTTTFLVALAVLGSLPTESSSEQEMNLQLERFEQIDGADIIDSSKLRVRKYNRTTFVLDGSIELFTDLDNAYEVTVKVAYSTLGNNQFAEALLRHAGDRVRRVSVHLEELHQHAVHREGNARVLSVSEGRLLGEGSDSGRFVCAAGRADRTVAHDLAASASRGAGGGAVCVLLSDYEGVLTVLCLLFQ